MAYYARSGDSVRTGRSQAHQMRRQRTLRPRRGGIPAPTFIIAGEVTTDILMPPKLIVSEGGDYPEFKQIVGFDGWLSIGGPVTVNWYSNSSALLLGHEIIGGSNPVTLAEPFIIEDREWIKMEIADTTAFPCFTLAAAIILEVVPV